MTYLYFFLQSLFVKYDIMNDVPGKKVVKYQIQRQYDDDDSYD